MKSGIYLKIKKAIINFKNEIYISINLKLCNLKNKRFITKLRFLL